MSIVINDLCGNCPVQAWGTIDGHEFYFRARGQSWSLEVGVDGDCWTYREPWGDHKYAAGWMTEDEAMECLAKGIHMFRERKRQEG